MSTTQLIQDQYIKVGSINTRYWSAGTHGTPVILLHGDGSSIEVWEHNIDKASVWAETIFSRLTQLGVRVELHNQDRTISKKIRELSKRRIPVIAIVGEQEAMNQTLNFRCLGAVEQQEMSLAQLEQKLADISMPSASFFP